MSAESIQTQVKRKRRWRELWRQNRSVLLMALAQLISSLTAVAAKLLQTAAQENEALDTGQVLITMMSFVITLSWLWILIARIPGVPFRKTNLWLLVTLRSITGVFGIWGFYYSLRALPLSEATVINFLSPMVAAYASSLLGRVPPFPRTQQLAIAVSFLGVVLVSQPWEHIQFAATDIRPETSNRRFFCMGGMWGLPHSTETRSIERIAAVGAGLVGVAGGAAAYVVMPLIGQDADPAVTVNHFATWVVGLTALSLAITGVDAWRMPHPAEWAQLVFLGVSGFIVHMLLATSMQHGGSPRTLSMVYIQIVFLLIMDAVVWGESPSWVSVGGGMLILGSVVTTMMLKGRREDGAAWKQRSRNEVADGEGTEMIAAKDHQESSFA
ncbi:hypothetical protein N7537_011926 [Penicillium hordei]|uniref:EamA domain-containing protein n=1 Tax=Penicillium hordei TaxID=40994 RepID=A0AAD6DMP3_9EURO|nr:uncharacterized protein N7537_011926 [Penicillium hordei]KAJ5589248.1 hypothetical protein N7537_011926 [Penicillium hordei]